MNQNRVPKGVPAGGQFSTGSRSEADGSLGVPDSSAQPGSSPALVDPHPGATWDHILDARELDPVVQDASSCETDVLWEYLEHPHPAVRAAAVANTALSYEQAELAANDPSAVVRLDVASLEYGSPQTRELLLADPHPVVRLRAAAAPDVPEAVRARVHSEPQVAALLKRIS